MKTNQWNAFLAVLLQNVDTEALDADRLQQSVIGDPKRVGDEFTRFLQNGCRVNLGELKIKPASFDPVSFIGHGWRAIPEEHDSRNDSLTEVDFSAVDVVTCLRDGEATITGEEKFARLKQSDRIRYGMVVFYGLWLDYQTRKENSVLEAMYRLRKICYLDFFGDVLESPGGYRSVLYFYCNDGRWYWNAIRLDYGWLAKSGSAVSQVASVFP